MEAPLNCLIFRCSKQPDMYLYLRAGLAPDALPEPLRKLTGRLTEVMRLALTPGRRLARVDVALVREQLQSRGYYLQMPPKGEVQGHLYEGD